MKNIASALVKAQKGFAPALKTSSIPHLKTKYADLAACVEAVIDSLNANGVMLTQQTRECENGVIVETVFVHESGEVFHGGPLHVPASKQDAQGYGSALSYARRYSLMAACGIAPEDDDGNAATRKPTEDAAYAAFEGEHLPTLRDAALRGTKALQEAFTALPAGPLKARMWEKHQKSLKDAAKGAE